MKLKYSKKEDTTYLWQTYKIAMKPHIDKIWGWDLAWQKVDFEKNLAKYTISLIYKASELIGYVQYNIEGQKCYINMLILEPKQQSQGIGAELLNCLTTENKLTTLSLRCFKVNNRAYKFYLREGFEIIDNQEHFYLLAKTI